jgi:hypothetical protein
MVAVRPPYIEDARFLKVKQQKLNGNSAVTFTRSSLLLLLHVLKAFISSLLGRQAARSCKNP